MESLRRVLWAGVHRRSPRKLAQPLRIERSQQDLESRSPTLEHWTAIELSRIPLQLARKKAPAVGFEPTTIRLTGERSTIELCWNKVATPHGFEP